MTENKGVLVIYTGGTIGSMPKDPEDDTSPQVVVSWDEFIERTPALTEKALGFKVAYAQTSKLLDSCNIGPAIWKEIASIIEENYHLYEGFVVLHGTDTMVYSATALSFMLVNLAKPVVFTGAQRTHLFQGRNDGEQNTITAVTIANPKASKIPVIPEVTILFGTALLRANRTRKADANGFDAYESPKFNALAKIGANITVDERQILPIPDGSFSVRRDLELSVIDFNVFPGIVENGVADMLLDSPTFKPKGVVVRAYGAGNIPTDQVFLKKIENAANNGTVFYNVTQCTRGRVELGLYETSNLLVPFMASGVDLTPEAALIKLMVALGDEDIRDNPSALRNYLQTSRVGEQSTSIYEVALVADDKAISAGTPRFRFAPDREFPGGWEARSLEGAAIRLYGAEVVGDAPIALDVYGGLSSSDPLPGPDSPAYEGLARRAPTPGNDKTILSFDVTNVTRRLFKAGGRGSYTLALAAGGRGSLSWKKAELALFIKEV